MSTFLTLAFLFFIGALGGWCLEVVFRKFFSSDNPEHKWVNPGFCTGPYLPIYGFGLCFLFLIASLEPLIVASSPFWTKTLLFITMAVCMTAVEYVGGLFLLKYYHIRLWDYRGLWGNVQGLICPLFSLFWAILGAMYYFLVHPYILNALHWLSQNLAFSFVIGLFYGVFIIDISNSLQLVNKLKQFAESNERILKYENIKLHIRAQQANRTGKRYFFRSFQSDQPLNEHLRDMLESFEKRIKNPK